MFELEKVRDVLLADGKWVIVQEKTLELSMMEVNGRQLPFFEFRSIEAHPQRYCIPVGSLDAMRYTD